MAVASEAALELLGARSITSSKALDGVIVDLVRVTCGPGGELRDVPLEELLPLELQPFARWVLCDSFVFGQNRVHRDDWPPRVIHPDDMGKKIAEMDSEAPATASRRRCAT